MITEFEKIRVTNGPQSVWYMKSDPIKHFLSQFDKHKDIFFMTDDKTAIETERMSNLTWHGRKGNFKNLDQVKFVYAGLEGEFYKPEDFGKLMVSVYNGRRSRVKPITI